MSVKLRLTRFGMKKRPFYRIVAIDSHAPRNGRYLELLGTYDPISKPAAIKLNKEKIDKWLKCGGDPTKTVKDILKNHYYTPKSANL